jgi:hypothetical protein
MGSVAAWGVVFLGMTSVCLGVLLSWLLPRTNDRVSSLVALAAILFLLLGSAIVVRGFGLGQEDDGVVWQGVAVDAR